MVLLAAVGELRAVDERTLKGPQPDQKENWCVQSLVEQELVCILCSISLTVSHTGATGLQRSNPFPASLEALKARAVYGSLEELRALVQRDEEGPGQSSAAKAPRRCLSGDSALHRLQFCDHEDHPAYDSSIFGRPIAQLVDPSGLPEAPLAPVPQMRWLEDVDMTFV